MSYKLKLKELRKAAGMTQQQLADVTGIRLGTLRTYEQGVSGALSLSDAVLICNALGTTPDDLCGWWDDHPRPARAEYADDRQAALNRAYESMNEKGRETAAGRVWEMLSVPGYVDATGEGADVPALGEAV